MRIDIRGDDNAGGWFLDYVGPEALSFMTIYTGPFATRSDAARSISEYRKVIAAALAS